MFDPGHDSTSMNEHDNMPFSTDLSSAAQLMGVKVDSQSVSQSVRVFTVVGGQLAHLTQLQFFRHDTDLGLCLFCIPCELVMDHLGKGVPAVFQPDLGCLIIRVCQHLEVHACV